MSESRWLILRSHFSLLVPWISETQRSVYQDQYICLGHAVSRRPDVFKKSCKSVFKTSSRCLAKTSLRRLQNVFKTSYKNLFKTSSRGLQDVLKTATRRLQDIFKASCKDIFKAFSRRAIRLGCLPTMARGVFGAGSGFRVEWHTAVGVYFLSFGGFLLVLRGFYFGGGAGRWAILLWGLDTFLMFPNSQGS